MIQRNVIVIVGKTGSGKSVLTKQIVKKAKRVIIIDPMEEYPGTVFYTFQQFIDYMMEKKPSVFQVVCRFEDDLDIDFLFKSVWVLPKELNLPDLLLVVEEVDSYVNPRVEDTPFMRIIRRGRHRKIHILGIAQRSPQFSSTLRAQKTTFISFAVDEPLDIETLKAYGFQEDQLKNLTVENHNYATLGVPVNDISFSTQDTQGIFAQTKVPGI